MKRKRHTTEEIIRKLREADQMVGSGDKIAQVCQKLEISEQTLGRGGSSAAAWAMRRSSVCVSLKKRTGA